MPLNKIETESLGSALNAPTATALATATGSAPSYAARAWVNFNGTGTVAIRASGNCSSVTDNGVGDYTINFTTAMSDANYSVVCTGNRDDSDAYRGTAGARSLTTTSVRLGCILESSTTIALDDTAITCATIFR